MCHTSSRLDIDQFARRKAQEYLHVIDPDYYEFEGNWELSDLFQTSILK